MKKIIFLLVLLSITITSYSQDVIRLTTKYVYCTAIDDVFEERVSFVLDFNSETLSITTNGNSISNRTHYIIDSKEVYDNELGKVYHIYVEPNYTGNLHGNRYPLNVLTITKDWITFTGTKSEPSFIYLFKN